MSIKSGGGQLAFSSTDSKTAKKKIDIKNLINQSKIKRLQNNLKQGKQLQPQYGASNAKVRLNVDTQYHKQPDDCAQDFKSEEATSPLANQAFGMLSAAHKDATSMGSNHQARQRYGQDNDQYNNIHNTNIITINSNMASNNRSARAREVSTQNE